MWCSKQGDTYAISSLLALSFLPLICDSNVLPDASTATPWSTSTTATTAALEKSHDIVIGPCVWAIGRHCPDKDVKFYLYTRRNLMDRQNLYIAETLEKSNLTSSHFNPRHPTKIIVHGYNSDMFLHPLHVMREGEYAVVDWKSFVASLSAEYLGKGEYNVIYVDWSVLSPGPCYISAVHNTKHAGACVALLVERILDMESADMHIVGFSLGAQLANYVARNLGSFRLPRITGLDPAMPLFITATANDKLDESDAEYVDVIHTNALVQGKLERCGHADFYMNGGIMQPGCYAQASNPFACAHQRAPAYFLESIRSRKGFWGWACSSYIAYMMGMCQPTNYLMEAGENVKHSTRGMFFVTTNSTSPYALGKWTDLPTLGAKRRPVSTAPVQTITIRAPPQSGDPLLRHVDQWGKLDSQFNNIKLEFEFEPTPFVADPLSDNWAYFSEAGTGDITQGQQHNQSIEPSSVEEQDGSYVHHTSNGFNWREYRHNLTRGHIENEIFTVPQVN